MSSGEAKAINQLSTVGHNQPMQSAAHSIAATERLDASRCQTLLENQETTPSAEGGLKKVPVSFRKSVAPAFDFHIECE